MLNRIFRRLAPRSSRLRKWLPISYFAVLVFCFSYFASSVLGWAVTTTPSCRVRSIEFQGWKAEELSNPWIRLIIVPQLGGRLMQVEFGGHAYLFVNPKYKGKYFPPEPNSKASEWFNYGGDKLWPLPEGRDDDQHWAGPKSDVLDDGDYKLTMVSEKPTCKVRLDGPADPVTGLQFSREISVGSDSPEVSFHALMTNSSAHPIRWSIQSVTQYDTADVRDPGRYNRDFWAFAPINAHSVYIDGYRVRNGLADDPSFEVNDGLFTLHWLYLENEVWLDSDAGWLAVVDNATKYGMIERFQYAASEEYPGKASVIFYKNGAALELDGEGMPMLRSSNPQEAPYYMEAEINSPMIQLAPGTSYVLDTRWFPVRVSKEIKTVAAVGVIERPLIAFFSAQGLHLSGVFGVFFPGKLTADVFDAHGTKSDVVLESVDPLNVVELDRTLQVSSEATRVALHLVNDQGADLGILGEALISKPRKDS